METVKKYFRNPILTPEDIPYKVFTVHNAAVVKFQNQYIMIFRSHLQNGRSVLGIAKSRDGFKFRAYDKPFMTPANEGDFAVYEEYGIEDPHITFIENKFYITYSAYSRYGVRIGLAATENFESVERIAFITQADNRNVVLFPEKFKGKYARLDRPHTNIFPWSIWISYSNDLIHWGESKILIKPLPYHWDEMKIGPGAPPIKTDKGWLCIYHGVFSTMSGGIYRLGVALLSLEDPSVVLGVADSWIVQPDKSFEISGYVSNVVFTCGAVPEIDGTVKIYWGGADNVMCVGTAKINELIQMCLRDKREAL